VGFTSPSPNALGIHGGGDGWLIIGIMIRVIRFQSLFNVIGITGRTLKTHCVTFIRTNTEIEIVRKGNVSEVKNGLLLFLETSETGSFGAP
jgi:hypothetical protein